METPADSEVDEDLIPVSNEIGSLFGSRWLIGALAFAAAFAIVGVLSARVQDASGGDVLRATYAHLAFELIEAGIPGIGAVVTVWLVFVSPRWSDRVLWSAAMILSATAIGANVMYAFPRMSAGQVTHSYPNSFALVGIIAYAGWLLIVHRSALSGGTRGVLGLLCVLALALPIAYPLINLYVRPIDVLGSYLLAASCLALGVYVAQRAGVELFERDGAARPGESGT